jgi:glucan phosphoethanolaminetransferase (alkaline phosphatase superfamily)
MISYLVLPVWLKFDPVTGELYKVFSTYLSHKVNPEATYQFTFLPYAYSGGVAVLTILISWIEIFKYKNRLTQIKLGTLNSLLITGSLVFLVYLTYKGQSEIMPNILGEYKIGLFMPAIALVLNSVANRFIRKDEKLVRSVDRIR